MKDLEKLEAHFRSEAEKHGSTPPPFIWDEVNSNLPQEKKKKKRLFYWILLGLSICSIAFLQRDRFITSEQYRIHQSQSSDSSIQHQSNIDSKDKIIDNTVTYHKQSIDGNNSEMSSIVTSTKFNQDQEIQSDLNTKTKSHYDTKINGGIKSSRLNSSMKSKTSSLEKTIILAEQNNHSSVIKRWDKEENLTAITSSVIMHSQNQIATSTEDIIIGLHNHTVTVLDGLPMLRASPFNLKAPIPPVLPIEYDLDNSAKPLDGVEQKTNSFFFEISSLIGTHNTDLTSELPVDSFYRSSSETNWYTWGAKVRIGYQLANSFSVKTGVDFIESRDKFNFRGETILPSSTQLSTTGLRFFSEGDLTYRQLNIPLTIGIEKTKGKVVFGLEGTLLLNLSFSAEGKIQTGLTTISRVENLEIYKRSLGLGYNGALILGYQISKQNSLYFRPTYSKYLSMTSKEDNDVTSNLSQYYIEIGFRRTMN